MKIINFSAALTLLLPLTLSAAFLDLTHAPSLSYQPMTFQIPGSSQQVEHCLPITTFPDSKLKSKRKKEEIKLCSYNIYDTGLATHPKVKELAACPKTYNSSTAIEFYKIPKGMTKREFQRKVCPMGRNERKRFSDRNKYPTKLAKFKFTSPGVTTGSILGYYQLARFLDAAEVPASVLRTVAIDFALDMSLTGLYLSRKARSKFLSKYWSQQSYIFVNSMFDSTSSVPRSVANDRRYGLGIVPNGYFLNNRRLRSASIGHWSERQLTSDQRQVVGVLAKNPRGERYYAEISGLKTRRPRIDQFRKGSVYYKPLQINRSLERVLGSRDLKKVGQKLKGMQDTSNLLVIDFLMGQSDRVGNIHYYDYYYYTNSEGKLKRIKEDSYKKLLKIPTAELSEKQQLVLQQLKVKGVELKVMLLKDNDGGFDLNKAKKYHLLAKVKRSSSSFRKWKNRPELYRNSSMVVKHFDPKVYKRLVKLYRWLENGSARQQEITDYLQNELRFTDQELKKFKNNLTALYNALYYNCLKGDLFLDLSLKEYFSNDQSRTNLSQQEVCEGQW